MSRQIGPESPEVLQFVDRFEQAWRDGSAPDIRSVLEPLDRQSQHRRILFEELVKLDLEFRWRQKLDPSSDILRVEDYVSKLDELTSVDQLPLDLVTQEYWVRHLWGDAPSHESFLERFPHLAQDLPSVLRSLDAALSAEIRKDTGTIGGTQTEWVCPVCYAAMPSPERSQEELICPSCGGRIVATSARVVGRLTSDNGAESHRQRPTELPRSSHRFVDRYELIERIGIGSFGSVWRARDAELDREVAVKIPRDEPAAADNDNERFIREARLAAQLKHPNIVPVHDVGRDGDTLYIVSEFVVGETLQQFLSRDALSLRQSAALVANVASAIGFAHEQGVVHRDLKPGNILLERIPAPAANLESATDNLTAQILAQRCIRPRVMDFGLAKGETPEATMTLDGHVLGTPAYMSPEQVRHSHSADARSDVYSLGVMLYQLGTGDLPFRGVARMVINQVLHDEPRAPRRLNDKMPRDMETIILRAMAKDPGARYATASELSIDLQCWLRGEPIRARPVSRAERAWSWCKRNPSIAALGSTCALLILLIGAVALAGYWRTKRALQQAESNLAQARSAVDDYFTAVSENQLLDVPGLQPLRKELLEHALAYYKNYVIQHADDPELILEVAAACLRTAEIHLHVGSKPEALARCRQAEEMLESIRDHASSQTACHQALAMAHNMHGVLIRDEGRPDEALNWFQKALDLRRQLVADSPTQRAERYLADTHSNMGLAHFSLGSFDKSIDAHLQALEIRERLVHTAEDQVASRDELAGTYTNLGQTYNQMADYQAAIEAYHKALEQNQAALADQPESLTLRSNLAVVHRNVGVAHHFTGDGELALAEYNKSAEINAELVRQNPSVHKYADNYAGDLAQAGALIAQLGDPKEGLRVMQQSVELYARLATEVPTNASYSNNLLKSKTNVAVILARSGRLDEAMGTYEEAMPLYEEMIRQYPDVIDHRQTAANCYYNLAEIYRRGGRSDDAIATANKSIRHLRIVLDISPDHFESVRKLAAANSVIGIVHRGLKQHDQAAVVLTESLRQLERSIEMRPDEVRFVLELGGGYCNLANVRQDLKQYDEALKLYERAIQTLGQIKPGNPWHANAQAFLRNTYIGRAVANENISRFDQALVDCEHAVTLRNLAGDRVRLARMRAATGEYRQTIDDARELSDQVTSGSDLHDLARAGALAVAAIDQDPSLDEATREALRSNAIGVAVSHLERARDADFALDPQAMNPDFEPLRKDPTFLHFLESLADRRGGDPT